MSNQTDKKLKEQKFGHTLIKLAETNKYNKQRRKSDNCEKY